MNSQLKRNGLNVGTFRMDNKSKLSIESIGKSNCSIIQKSCIRVPNFGKIPRDDISHGSNDIFSMGFADRNHGFSAGSHCPRLGPVPLKRPVFGCGTGPAVEDLLEQYHITSELKINYLMMLVIL